ncbi:hypothetical protein [Arthrobacter castelli]|uniref:hypothetical protein n=1 Tax=Arthrobacter castelli TaxID=271431 RepID=UPI00041729BF|nr:hypothetical protein [Arthrobacter castelli]
MPKPNSNLEATDLLVNTIGNYSGTLLFDDGFGGDGTETETLEIMADGAWKIELLSLDAMKSFDDAEAITGTGDTVFYHTGDSSIATVSYPGSSNIAIIQHGYETDLVVVGSRWLVIASGDGCGTRPGRLGERVPHVQSCRAAACGV